MNKETGNRPSGGSGRMSKGARNTLWALVAVVVVVVAFAFYDNWTQPRAVTPTERGPAQVQPYQAPYETEGEPPRAPEVEPPVEGDKSPTQKNQ